MEISKDNLNLVMKYIDEGEVTYIGDNDEDGYYQIGYEPFAIKTGIEGCIEYCKGAEEQRKFNVESYKSLLESYFKRELTEKEINAVKMFRGD